MLYVIPLFLILLYNFDSFLCLSSLIVDAARQYSLYRQSLLYMTSDTALGHVRRVYLLPFSFFFFFLFVLFFFSILFIAARRCKLWRCDLGRKGIRRPETWFSRPDAPYR